MGCKTDISAIDFLHRLSNNSVPKSDPAIEKYKNLVEEDYIKLNRNGKYELTDKGNNVVGFFNKRIDKDLRTY